MDKIRPSFMKEIKESLNLYLFRYTDFTFEDPNPKSYDKNARLKIIYKHDTKYYFSFEHISAGEQNFSIARMPGNISKNEFFEIDSKRKLKISISNWLLSLKEDLEASPEIRLIFDIESTVSEMEKKVLENLNDTKDDFYSKEEVEQLKKNLDNIKEEFEEKLNAQEEKNFNLKSQIKEIKEDIENLKKLAEVSTKKSFSFAFIGRFALWMSKPETQQLLGGIIRSANLLPGVDIPKYPD